jgi:D-inositol-3-phosphate glycosyltransferase
VLDGTTGLLVTSGHPEALAQPVRKLLGHPMMLEAFGVAASDRVRSRYGWDRIAGETVAVYENAACATPLAA